MDLHVHIDTTVHPHRTVLFVRSSCAIDIIELPSAPCLPALTDDDDDDASTTELQAVREWLPSISTSQ